MRGEDTRIALINENSQGTKNGMIYHVLKKVADHYGYEVDNYGVYMAEDQTQFTYVQVGILVVAPLNSKVADYVVIGCGTGEGTMPACNSPPGATCGHVGDTLDAYTFAQTNDGNAIVLPLAEGFDWDGGLNLEYIFEKLFCGPSGQGYPRERVVPEQRNKKILDEVRKVTFKEDLVEILRGPDQELAKGAFAGERFLELFFETCRDEKLASYIRGLLVQL